MFARDDHVAAEHPPVVAVAVDGAALSEHRQEYVPTEQGTRARGAAPRWRSPREPVHSRYPSPVVGAPPRGSIITSPSTEATEPMSDDARRVANRLADRRGVPHALRVQWRSVARAPRGRPRECACAKYGSSLDVRSMFISASTLRVGLFEQTKRARWPTASAPVKAAAVGTMTTSALSKTRGTVHPTRGRHEER